MVDQIIPIYSGKSEDFHYAGFGSGSGTNLEACADKVALPSLIFSDKNPYNPLTDKGAKVAETDPKKLKEYGLEHLIDVPRIIVNGFEMCGSSKIQSAEEYFRRSLDFNKRIVEELHKFEQKQGYGIDLIVLGGYMRLVLDPLLEAYPDKIINVHPADLSILVNNKRLFVGDRAVYDALLAYERSTRSSVIMVDGKVDHGEMLAIGPKVEVSDEDFEKLKFDTDYLSEYAPIHQNRQKRESDWPALTTALKLISEGRLALGTKKMHHGEWRRVYLDGKHLPYAGLRV